MFPPGLGNRGRFRPHLGVAYLQAVLSSQGIGSSQFVSPYSITTNQAVTEIMSSRPRVVGITAYDSNYGVCLNLAERIKAASPETWVLFGGPTPTFGHEYILKTQPSVDLCVRGETEQTGSTLFNALLSARPGDISGFRDLPGLAFRDGGEIVTTGMPPLSGELTARGRELDCLLSPYLEGTLRDGRPGILTGRGCTNHCVYCCFAALARRKLRLHSPERVVSELEVLSRRMHRRGDIYRVTIFDDAFTLLPPRAKKICEMIAVKDLRLPLSCITRADTIDLELMRLMKAAGFMAVAFGLESAVPSVLRAIGKVRPPNWHDPDLSPEEEFVRRVEQSVRWAKEEGLVVGVSIIVGLPTETPEHAAKTMAFVESLPVDYYMHNSLSVFPGTPLWDNQEDYGIGSTLNVLGLPVTTRMPYDVNSVRPARKSNRANEALLVQALAIEGLYGCEALQGRENQITMAVIHADRIDRGLARWLAGILGVGGSVIQVCSDAQLFDRRETLLDDRNILAGAYVPNRYHIQLVPMPSEGSLRRWRVLSEVSYVFESHSPEIVTITEDLEGGSLGAWVEGGSIPPDICQPDMLLQRPGKLADLVERIAEKGLVEAARTFPSPPTLAYAGRWTSNDRPACMALNRIEVDAEGRVRVCRHGDVLGTVGEDLKTLRGRLSQACADVYKKRGAGPVSLNGRGCPFPNLTAEQHGQIKAEAISSNLRGITALSRIQKVLINVRDEFE